MMDMQDQEKEKEKVGELVHLEWDEYLGAEECVEALKAALFPVETQPGDQLSAFANWFLQNRDEGIGFALVNWRVLREELESRVARKRQANQGS